MVFQSARHFYMCLDFTAHAYARMMQHSAIECATERAYSRLIELLLLSLRSIPNNLLKEEGYLTKEKLNELSKTERIWKYSLDLMCQTGTSS